MSTAVEKATAFVEMKLRRINERSRVALTLAEHNPVNVYMDVKNGRGARLSDGTIAAKLPIIGMRDLSRVGDELDRQRAEIVVVFTVTGIVNGVPYSDVTIWITGDKVTLPTLFSGTAKAREVFYDLGREVRDVVASATTLQSQAWEAHLVSLVNRVNEARAYLDAVVHGAMAVAPAHQPRGVGVAK